jgi:hypothetical protein
MTVTVNERPILSSEKMSHINKPGTDSDKNLVLGLTSKYNGRDITFTLSEGHMAVSTVVKALCYKPEDRGFET